MTQPIPAADQQVLEDLRQYFPQATAARLRFVQENGQRGPEVTVFRLTPDGAMMHRGQATVHIRREQMKARRAAAQQ